MLGEGCWPWSVTITVAEPSFFQECTPKEDSGQCCSKRASGLLLRRYILSDLRMSDCICTRCIREETEGWWVCVSPDVQELEQRLPGAL